MTAIIILNWNGATDTIECIESLRYVQDDYFCVVADNGSEDHSIELIEQYFQKENIIHHVIEYGEALYDKPQNHEFILYKINENLGFAQGNNEAIRLITATIRPNHYLLLNNDTIVEPDFLKHLNCFAKEHPTYQALTPLICHHCNHNLIWNAGGKQKWGFRKYHYAQQPLQKIKEIGHIDVTFLTGCALYADASLLQQDGGLLTERFFFGEEDFEFCLRMNQQKKKMACVLPSKIYHKVNASIAKVEPIGKTYIYYLNRFIDMRQHLSPSTFRLWTFLYFFYIYLLLRRLGNSHRVCMRFITKVKKESRKREKVTHADFLEAITCFTLS